MPSLFNFSGQTPTTQQEVESKRKLAQMLMQGAMNPNYGNANAPAMALMPLAMAFAASRADRQAKQGEEGLKAQRQSEMAKILAAGQGTTEQVPIQGPVREEDAPLGSYEKKIPGSREAMIQAMIGSSLPDMNTAGLKMMSEQSKPQEWKLGTIGSKGDQTQSIFYNTTDPSQFRPVGDPVSKRDGVNVNVAGPEVVDPIAPWRNIRDPKKRDEAKMRYGMEAEKELTKAQGEVEKGVNLSNDLDRFLALNETNRTGGEYKIPGAQFVRGAFDGEFNEMASIVDRLTPAMRQGMPGAASDSDVKMFRGATVGVDKPKETNNSIASGMKIANDNLSQRQQFMRDYLVQKGHTNGAEAEWKAYLNANPIFDPTKPKGSYSLNPNRKSYQEWKSGGSSDGSNGGIKFLGFENG